MRIRLFTDMEIDPTQILDAVRQGQPEAPEEIVPQLVAQAVHNLIEQAIPGVQATGSVVLPDLAQASAIIKPAPGRIIV